MKSEVGHNRTEVFNIAERRELTEMPLRGWLLVTGYLLLVQRLAGHRVAGTGMPTQCVCIVNIRYSSRTWLDSIKILTGLPVFLTQW